MPTDPSDEAQGPSPMPWLDTCAVAGCSLRIRYVGDESGLGPPWVHVDPTGRGWSTQFPPSHRATPRP